MAVVVLADILQELLHKMWTFGTWSHYAHVSLQNIDELRQLIEASFSQDTPDTRPSVVGLGRPADVAVGGTAHSHRTKLIHLKWQAIESDPVLHEENGPRRSQPNQYCDQTNERSNCKEREDRKTDIEDSLEQSVVKQIGRSCREVEHLHPPHLE